MKKTFFLSAILLMTIGLVSCEQKNISEEPIITINDFVGTYSLSGSGISYASNGTEQDSIKITIPSGKTVTISKSSDNSATITGYFGTTTATLENGKLNVTEVKVSGIRENYSLNGQYAFSYWTKSGSNLSFMVAETLVMIKLVSPYTVISSIGTIDVIATKQ